MRPFLTCAAVVLAACNAAAQPGAPAPRAANLTDSTFGGRLWVPPGFTITEFASVPGARLMALGADGSVYVSQPGKGQITRLADADRDGRAESQTVAVRGLDRPHGMAFHDGWLYVANTSHVVRVRLDGQGQAIGTPAELASYSGGGNHWSRTVIFGRDGAMYVSIGSSCNVCKESDEDRATVMRFDADGRNGRIFSRGLRNAVGMAVHPATGEIWVTQNERDNLRPEHEDLPPEEINILVDGGHFGWPYCHSNRVPSPDGGDASRCPATLPPTLALQAHSAPLGITFLDRARGLATGWSGDALVAYHGSWNRDTPTGAKVVRIRVSNGKPVGVEDFISGWQDARGKRWGRPVDVMVAADGAILVSDDQTGTIYRVTR